MGGSLPAKENVHWFYIMGVVFWHSHFDSDRQVKQLSHGLCLGRAEVLRNLRQDLRAQSQGHCSTNRLEERHGERKCQSSLKGQEGPSSIRWTLELCFKSSAGKTSKRLDGMHMDFFKCMSWTGLTYNMRAPPAVLLADDWVSRGMESSKEQTCTMSIHHFHCVDSGH